MDINWLDCCPAVEKRSNLRFASGVETEASLMPFSMWKT